MLTLLDARLACGALPLLDRAAFSMEGGERIGLIGRNATGKSSLLSLIAGRVALVEQEPSLPAAARGPQNEGVRASLRAARGFLARKRPRSQRSRCPRNRVNSKQRMSERAANRDLVVHAHDDGYRYCYCCSHER